MGELTGKELGIAVAKEVMGWTEINYREFFVFDYDGPLPAFYLRNADRDWLTVCENMNKTRAWAPWRNMNDAWEAVEKLRDDGWRFCLSDFKSIYGEQWEAWFHKGTYGIRVESTAEVLCEAILRAALKAMREEAVNAKEHPSV